MKLATKNVSPVSVVGSLVGGSIVVGNVRELVHMKTVLFVV